MPELKQLEDELAKVKADKAALEAKLKEQDSKAVAALEDAVKAKSEKLTTVEAEKAELLKTIEELGIKLNSATADLQKIQSEQKLATRISTVVDKLKADKETAVKLVANLIGLSDENFEATIVGMADMAKPAAITPGAPVNPPMTNSPIGEANPLPITNKGAAAVGDPSAIANAQPDPEPALAVAAAGNEGMQKTVAEIAEWYTNEENQ